jgi:ABC-type proline/glycine betaine transport system permease subunit
VLPLILEHLWLVFAATAAASALAIPAGIAISHRPVLARWTLASASVAQTIPSLALLGFLISIPVIGGIGPRPALVALIVYALLPILTNTVAGLRNVDPALREAGLALGMTPSQFLRKVELPLAAPTIVAGVRIAAVTTVGTAAIAAAIGGGGLGVLIFRGLEILRGALPAAGIAIITNGGLSWIENRLSRFWPS